MVRPWGASAALVVLLAGATATASAGPTPTSTSPSLELAKTAVESSDYPTARTALAEALASGAHGRDELAELYRLSGIVSAALGDAKASTAAFQRALALAPRLALPPGTSPKIVRPFTAAQGLAKDAGALEIRSETSASPPSVTVIVASDPQAMIARVRAVVVVDGAPEQTFDRPASERTTIELPPGRRLDVRVSAVDEHGNRLAELGSREVPIVILGKGAPEPRVAPGAGGAAAASGRAGALPPGPAAPDRPREPRPVYLAWWLWGGAAIALGGAATYFGVDALRASRELQALNRDSVNHTFDEARRLESRAERGVLLANIGYGVAAAFAVTGAILYLTEPRGRGEPRVTLAPVGGGGAIVLGGSF